MHRKCRHVDELGVASSSQFYKRFAALKSRNTDSKRLTDSARECRTTHAEVVRRFDEKLDQNQELAELRADTSLTKQMMSQEAKMANDIMKQQDVRILKGPKR